MEEDDDFYGNGASTALPTVGEQALGSALASANGQRMEQDDDQDEELEEGEEEEDSDDDSVEIITERKDAPPPEPIHKAHFGDPKTEPIRATSVDQPPRATTQQPVASKPAATVPVAQLKSGAGYPEVRTSTIDVNAVPSYDAAGKLITEIDIDADLAEHSKPWRLPGADQSDYFNYGFDEFTWTQYCLRQKDMSQKLSNQKEETAQFQNMFSTMNIPGMPSLPSSTNATSQPGISGAPTGPAATNQQQQPTPQMGATGSANAMSGMDDMMMQQMIGHMMSQGIDPSQMDFNTFAQAFQQMQGPGPTGGTQIPQGPAAQQQGQFNQQAGGQGAYGGYGNQNAGGYGRGRGGRRW